MAKKRRTCVRWEGEVKMKVMNKRGDQQGLYRGPGVGGCIQRISRCVPWGR
ncbi:hypothetical protein AN958_00082 [Leucoagaricus sp. SymC.cos]|nr:hypothetical protein AN958_00082 [Leucoagaricus sp. SymC.cos]